MASIYHPFAKRLFSAHWVCCTRGFSPDMLHLSGPRNFLSPHSLHPLTNSSTRALFNTTLLLEASRIEFYLLCLLSLPSLDLALKHPVPPTDRGHFLCITAAYKSPCHLLCNRHVLDTMLQSLHSFCHLIFTATL